jgi:hypothetical protein
VAVAQSLAAAQPHTPVASHTVPLALAAQSAAAAQPQVFDVVLHTAPRTLVAQSLLVTHPTHSPVLASQAGAKLLPAQSALVVHALMQIPGMAGPGMGPFRTRQMYPVAQSPFTAQPQVFIVHCLPLAAPAQSVLVAQPH